MIFIRAEYLIHSCIRSLMKSGAWYLALYIHITLCCVCVFLCISPRINWNASSMFKPFWIEDRLTVPMGALRFLMNLRPTSIFVEWNGREKVRRNYDIQNNITNTIQPTEYHSEYTIVPIVYVVVMYLLHLVNKVVTLATSATDQCGCLWVSLYRSTSVGLQPLPIDEN